MRRRRWCTTSPAAISTTTLCDGSRPRPGDAPAGPPVDGGGRHPAARRRRRVRVCRATCAVVVGTGDEHAASVGAGAIEPGVVVDVTGTAEPVTTVVRGTRPRSARSRGDPRPRGARFVADRESRIRQRRKHTVARRAARRAAGRGLQRCAAAPPASDGVLFLPALSGSTAPRWNDSDAWRFPRPRDEPHAGARRRARYSKAAHMRCATSSIDSTHSASATARYASSAAARGTTCGRRSRPTCSAGRCGAC